ncbi:MAG: hypothetical protein ABIG89_06805 [Candidatus Woesearchaeota archaeon]
MTKFKILLTNIGYCTGLNGSLSDYVFKFYRYIYTSKKVQLDVLNKLSRIVNKEKLDLIVLIEIKKYQMEMLKRIISNDKNNNKYNLFEVENKYSLKSLLRKILFIKNNCNGFIAKKNLKFEKHYLENGTKKLLYEIKLPNDTVLVATHFSLNKKTRKKQFDEISEKFKSKKMIVCGDFNIFDGFDELNSIMEKCELKIANDKPTFPSNLCCSSKKSNNRKKALDLFLCSEKMKVNVKIIKDDFSDHMPILLEIEL